MLRTSSPDIARTAESSQEKEKQENGSLLLPMRHIYERDAKRHWRDCVIV
jgi:hypothetical protein